MPMISTLIKMNKQPRVSSLLQKDHCNQVVFHERLPVIEYQKRKRIITPWTFQLNAPDSSISQLSNINQTVSIDGPSLYPAQPILGVTPSKVILCFQLVLPQFRQGCHVLAHMETIRPAFIIMSSHTCEQRLHQRDNPQQTSVEQTMFQFHPQL